MEFEDREQLKRITGLSDAEIDEHTACAMQALHKMRHLISAWIDILDALEEGELDTAGYLSEQASWFISELDENTLRWMVSGATKAIATKMRAEAALDDIDPVAAAEQLLRESGDG